MDSEFEVFRLVGCGGRSVGVIGGSCRTFYNALAVAEVLRVRTLVAMAKRLEACGEHAIKGN